MIIVDLKMQSHDVFGDIDYMVCRAQKTPPDGGARNRPPKAAGYQVVRYFAASIAAMKRL